MGRIRASIPESSEPGRPWERLDPDRFYGLVAVVVGLGQLPLAFASVPARPTPAFVVASGGMLLVAIGTNLFRGKAPFESGWAEDGEPGVGSVAVLSLATLAVVVASAVAVIP